MDQLGPWVCLAVVLTPLWIFLVVLFVLRPLLRWDDERRGRKKQQPGFEVKQNTGGESPVLREKENDHG
jgi:hypothetical protein